MRRTSNRTAASGNRLHVFRAMAFCLVAVSAWAVINVHNLQEYIDTRQKREQESEQIDILKQRIKRLKRQQQSLAYNGVESEKQIRERLQMHLPGEKVIFLKEGPALKQGAAVTGAKKDVLQLSDSDQKTATKPEKAMALNKTGTPQ